LLASVAACVVAVAVVLGGGAAWGLWSFSKIKRVDLDLEQAEAATEPINVLVVGSDSRAEITEDDPGAGGMLGDEAPTGQRSDSLMIARIDPTSDRIDLLSIPRDLWVTIPGQEGEHRINTAYQQSAQTVVDTVQSVLGIPVNHFVEVDFSGFQSLIEALGGVPMYFDHPVRDKNSGLNIETKGCHVLDGQQGLAFARSRHLEWSNGVKWSSDPTGDLGRMTRQQLLTRAAMAKAQTLGLNNVGTLKSLVDAGIGSVQLDDTFGTGDLIDLGKRLSSFDPEHMQTHSLPVVAHETSGGAAVVLLDQVAAQPTLDIFRGAATAAPVTTTTAPPPSEDEVTVEVVNATGVEGEARRVSFVLTDGGFVPGEVLPSDGTEARSEIRYAKGQQRMAELVAGWLSATPELVEDADVPSGTVSVILGTDFDRVAEPDEAPATTTTAAPEASVDPAAPTVPETTTTTQPGWQPGVPPEGTSCP
jgi:LCP family protein required for cell wall assembly